MDILLSSRPHRPACTVAHQIVHLWTPDGEIECPKIALVKLLTAGYQQQGCSEVVSCCHSKGCLIVPNPQKNQTQLFKMGYYDSRAFRGHRFFSSFDQITEVLYRLFQQYLTIELLDPGHSLFTKLARQPNWLTSDNRGALSTEEPTS